MKKEVEELLLDIVSDIFELFLDCPDYNLKGQITRTAVYLKSNLVVAEKEHDEYSYKNYLKTLDELKTLIFVSYKLEVISLEDKNRLEEKLLNLSKMSINIYNKIDKWYECEV